MELPENQSIVYAIIASNNGITYKRIRELFGKVKEKKDAQCSDEIKGLMKKELICKTGLFKWTKYFIHNK